MSFFDNLLGKGSWYNPAGFIGNAGDLKKFAGTKMGSMMSGRAILQGGPKEQDMESARTFDLFGSPATAGGKQQTSARSLAALYGLFAGGAALAGGGAGGASGGAAGGPSSGMGSWFGSSAQGGGGSTAGGWQNYARLGNAVMQQGQQGQGAQGQSLQHQYVGENPRNPYLTPLSTQPQQQQLYALQQALEREGQGDLYRQGGLYGAPGSTYGI
jgi:hypothetical protein